MAKTLPPSPAPNTPAPNFSLRDQHGERHSLSDFRGRGLVIFFYPEDDTPLCTEEACQFREHHGDFGKVNCTVIGISPDDQASHAAFAAKHSFPFPLLVDEKDDRGNPRISTLYGAFGEKNMYGNITRAMLRTTVLVGPDGRIVRRWDRVKTPGHASAVLAAAKALHAGATTPIIRETKPSKRLTTRKPHRNTTKGRTAYAGVRATKSKSNPTRAIATKAKARQTRTKGRPR
jgi:peroxiredoxin Q/BCP